MSCLWQISHAYNLLDVKKDGDKDLKADGAKTHKGVLEERYETCGDKVQQIQKWDFIAEKVKENSSKIFENEFDF